MMFYITLNLIKIFIYIFVDADFLWLVLDMKIATLPVSFCTVCDPVLKFFC